MAKIEYVDLSNLSEKIKKELDNYKKDVYGALVETCEEGIKEAKKEIVRDLDTMQKGKKSELGKHYRSTFTTRKKGDLSRILWNKKYQLSHLLENGHFVYNQYGGAYEIHPTIAKRGKWITGSKYGTSGKITKAFGVWDKTEKHTAQFVEDTLMKKLK